MRRCRARSDLDSNAAETMKTEKEVPQLLDMSSTSTWIGFKCGFFCKTDFTSSTFNGILAATRKCAMYAAKRRVGRTRRRRALSFGRVA